ncbi:SET domain-containing protein [Sporormia fimetaria CBS 119925]|uniref:SET domain-containing protein n=1 Tax=Sporormia fimetaria CBS 119925 TaxID=1340428 RepID=A0A6A6UZC1_9PLEO|nr:SET domain-containing protein [Sporormia fimetaria CBS 119925]
MSPLTARRPSLPKILAAAILSSRWASVTAIDVLYGHSNRVQNILELPLHQTCPVVSNGLTSTSFPWTHNPTCVQASMPDGETRETFCVYTNSRFANGRGISIVTTPEVATSYLLESFSHEDQEDHGQELYESRVTKERGTALFSTKSVKAGDSLILKHPNVIVTRNILHPFAREERHRLLDLAVAQLPEKTTKTILGLAKSRGGFPLDDIVQTNAMGMRLGEVDGVGHLGVVPEASRINHSCRPNTYYRFDDYTLTLNLFAVRDIEAGEELTYSYGFYDRPHELRTQILQENWGFKCTCALCSSSPSQIAESDKRLADIADMKEGLPVGFDNVPQFIALLPPLIKLMDEEGLFIEKPMYEEILAYSWSVLANEGRAKYWAGRAARDWEIIAGKESGEARRTRVLWRDVKGHGTWATWDKDPWDDSVWEDDDHHDHDHDH